MNHLRITYIGGPTMLLELDGTRILTDPTFDPEGGDYPSGPVTLHKLSPPAIQMKDLPPIDYVLLSHDHHFDNLDPCRTPIPGVGETRFDYCRRRTAPGWKQLWDESVGEPGSADRT